MPSTMPESGLAAVIFDWAGTVVDFGSRAPLAAFIDLFAGEGVDIGEAEARAPMGLPKREHIRAIAAQPRVARAWLAIKGFDFAESDLERMYAAYTPMNLRTVAAHSGLIQGTLELVAALRDRGIRIGTTTGYNREIIDAVIPLAAEQGFVPDLVISADDVPSSRPSPLAMYRAFVELGVWPAHRVLKVDDTVPGLLEGRNAGCWTAGLAASGNALGMSLQEWQSLRGPARTAAIAAGEAALAGGRPDLVVPTVAELLPAIDAIDARVRRGERPPL